MRRSLNVRNGEMSSFAPGWIDAVQISVMVGKYKWLVRMAADTAHSHWPI